MFTSRAVGFVSGPYKDTSEVPRGLGAKHEADGVLRILPEFEMGLTDIEGFSHLIVLWEFDRALGFNCFGARVASCMFVGSICWMGQLFLISSHYFPAYRLRGCDVDGWRRQRHGGRVDVAAVRSGNPHFLQSAREMRNP
jgi:hypothetical protein